MGANSADAYAAIHFRWNFVVLVTESAAFWSGLAFMESTTVLPVLLSRLHASNAVVGLARFIQTLGFTLPAIVAAHHIHGRASHKSFLIWACALARSGLLLLPPLFFFFGVARPEFALVTFLVIYGIFWTVDGACAVSWLDIIAKTIPMPVRGRFFGVMQTLGGIAAIGAGFIVKDLLQHRPFPVNFALLAVGWCCALAVSQVSLVLIREPHGRAVEAEDKPSFIEYVRQTVPLLRTNRRLAHLIATRLLLDGAGMAAPFYVLYAQRDLHTGLRMVGIYAIVQSAGKVCMGPVWGWISDHAGPSNGLRAVALGVFAIPAIAIAAAHGGALVYPAVFFLLGAIQDGTWMVSQTAVLASLPESDRSLGLGVYSVFQMPGALYGISGGLLAQLATFHTLFVVALVFAASGLLMALRLRRESG